MHIEGVGKERERKREREREREREGEGQERGVNRGRPTSPWAPDNGAVQRSQLRGVMDQDTNQTAAMAVGVKPEGCLHTTSKKGQLSQYNSHCTKRWPEG